MGRKRTPGRLYSYHSYDDYVEAQTKANKRKFYRVWVKDMELGIIANYIAINFPGISSVLCHGARNGHEVRILRELLGMDVFGTDISETAKDIEHMFVHDFHKPWNRFRPDVIYCNALDHACDPRLAVETWMKTILPGGCCLVHWSGSHEKKKLDKPELLGQKGCVADCFEGSKKDYMELFNAFVVDSFEIKIHHGSTVFVVKNA